MTEEFISKTKLFVGGLNWKLRGAELNEEFSKFGEVVFARVVLGPDRRSKGFGFVEFANEDDAAKAQAEMNETEYEGRTIKVDFAKENPEKMRAREESMGTEEVQDESVEEKEGSTE